MADRKSIIALPNDSLRERSKKVSVIDDEVKKVIKDMKDATLDWEDNRDHEFGVALAAVQINKHLRIVVVRSDLENKDDRTFQVFINPQIVQKSGKPVEDLVCQSLVVGIVIGVVDKDVIVHGNDDSSHTNRARGYHESIIHISDKTASWFVD